MYFITEKTSDTGKKFAEVVKKRNIAWKAAKAFAEKYNIIEWRPADIVTDSKNRTHFSMWGGISSMIFKQIPDKSIYKNVYGSSKEWMPRRNKAAGLEIWKELDKLPVVTMDELNSAIGYKGDFNAHIGFAQTSKKFFGFITKSKWKIKIPADCKEVTETEYRKIFNIKENE